MFACEKCDINFDQFFELMKEQRGIQFEQAEKSVSCLFLIPSVFGN